MGLGKIGRTARDRTLWRAAPLPIGVLSSTRKLHGRQTPRNVVALIVVAEHRRGLRCRMDPNVLVGRSAVNILVVTDQTVTRDLMISVAHAAFPEATVQVAANLASALVDARSMAGLDMVLLISGCPIAKGLMGCGISGPTFRNAKVVIVSSQDAPELITEALTSGQGAHREELRHFGRGAATRGAGGIDHASSQDLKVQKVRAHVLPRVPARSNVPPFG